ncbi:MAG: methyltransferase domain-containing protein [Candidatus Levybacteria bacterium]|nr:methyltransferase domain-containing protein [Candidatus Levybacteria bacterium]
MDPYVAIKDIYTQIAEPYTKHYGYSSFLLRNVKKFSSNLPPGGRVLDLGCGSGRALKLFVERGFTVVGIDFSDALLRLARKFVLGAKKKWIIAQFLTESVLLTVAGGILGMLLGIILSFVISRFINLPFTVSLSSVILAVGVSGGIGILFGWYPARRAANMPPIEALRYE